MKGKKRKGASLPMVIIAMIVITILVAVMASVITTANTQTVRMTQYLKAKYVATSGTQLALGAYHGKKGQLTTLRQEFEKRANNPQYKGEVVRSEHTFSYQGETYGQANIEMTGDFSMKDNGSTLTNKSTNSSDYMVTITSKARLGDSDDYYIHEVTFNIMSNGIRSEKGGLRKDAKN